jgi:phosphoribosylanthranilate isomerase
VLAGGLDAGNVRQAIHKVRPYAVDVSSGVEADKVIKDNVKMATFINEVNETDKIL